MDWFYDEKALVFAQELDPAILIHFQVEAPEPNHLTPL